MLKSFIKFISIIIGRFLFFSPTWDHIRKNCFNFPGQNFHEEIKKKSKILFYLNESYYSYFNYRYKNLPQREFQKVHWDDYGIYYYENRDGMELNEIFIKNFKDMLINTDSVLEIGCGGFILTKYLAKKNPNVKFYGYDLSESSEHIYKNKVKSEYKNIYFKKSNIFDDMEFIEQVPFIYTYNVFMHFNEYDINIFFEFISNMQNAVTLILQEPHTNRCMSFNYKEKDYLHNYEEYIKKYNFKLLDLNLSTPDSGIFYFATN